VNQVHIKSAFEMDDDFKNLALKMGIQSTLLSGKKRKAGPTTPVPTQKTVTGKTKKN
jgi:hypothetical protein